MLPQVSIQTGSSNSFGGLQPGSNGSIVHKPVPIQPGTQAPPFYDVLLDVTPAISKDDFMVELNVVSSMSEFIGYDYPAHYKTDMEGKPVNGNPSGGLPHYRLRQLTSAFSVWDGQTVVISGRLNNLPPEDTAKPNKGKKNSLPVNRTLMIFVTPTLINPDGTPYHTEKETALKLEKINNQSN